MTHQLQSVKTSRRHPLFVLIAVAVLTAGAAVAKDTISDYFLRLPASEFLEGTPAQLLGYIRTNRQGVLDTKNGYLVLQGDGAQVSLQVALFRFPDGGPLLAVSYGYLEEPDFTNLDFFIEQDGKMVLTHRIEFPFPPRGGRFRFQLPREGRTIIVKKSDGRPVGKVTWNGYKFVMEQ